MMWWYPGWGWGAWLGMSLMMLVFWGAVIWLIVTLVRKSAKQDVTPPPWRAEDVTPPRRAEEVLAERFARGEIDEAEYQDRLRVLQGTPAGPPTRLDKTLDKTGAGR